MNLNYRGVVFDFVPPEEETTLQPVDGQYRGQPVSQMTTHAAADLSSVPFDLTFRGVPYHQAAEASASPAVPSLDSVMASPQISESSSDLHQQNISDRLQRRIQSAQAKGDLTLVQQLEDERNRLIAH